MFHLYGLIIGFSFLTGLFYFQKHSNLDKKYHDNLFYGLIIFGILGARLYHVADLWGYYSRYPIQIPQVWQGGLGIYGGFIGCLFFTIYFCKKHKLNLLNLLNQIAPSIPLMQSIARWGNGINHEIYSPQGLPVWLYESIACLVLFLIIHKIKNNNFANYLIGYGLIRFVLEFLREDTWQIYGLKIAQLISLTLILVGIILPRLTLGITMSNAKNRNR